MAEQKSAGVLLHPTSLPGPEGIGTLGRAAREFVDFLAAAGLRCWQVLPLCPTGYGNSPYASIGGSAGNPLLIDLEDLVVRGLLTSVELTAARAAAKGNERVAFDRLIDGKLPLVDLAAERLLDGHTEAASVATFCERHRRWLDDFALFGAIKTRLDARARAEGVKDSSWNVYWPAALRDVSHAREVLQSGRDPELAAAVERNKVVQYLFASQWEALRHYARQHEVSLVGDLPIYVAADSADVWANPAVFRLDAQFQPTCVAGVPPDYYSATGQLWGNPIYNWEYLQKTGFRFWIDRLARMLELVDVVRIDHFRGFAACWEVPAGAETALDGKWVPAPGKALFDAARDELGSFDVIAEDLGVITDDVVALRESLGFPGMYLLQGAFDFDEDRHAYFLPSNHQRNGVVYPGTHDNPTTAAWLKRRSPQELALFAEHAARCTMHEPVWQMIELCLASPARRAIIPMQDVLGLDEEGRMNTPATLAGNWEWRLEPGYRTPELVARLRELCRSSGR